MVTGEESGLFLEHRQGESGIRVRGTFIPFLKKGQQLDVIICTPKGWNPLEARGVIVPGSQTGQCDHCGQDIWIAPSTQELMKDYPDVPTRCLDCVRKELEKLEGEDMTKEEEETTTEWLDEPDKEEFEHTQLKCLILRNPRLGHLCGYVGVPKGHPCYGKDYSHIPYDDLFPVEVHGGLTFSSEGDGDRWPEGYWWLGFDCAHAWDLVPYMPFGSSGTYRNFQYVRRETTELADQVAILDFIDWEFTWVWPLLLPIRTARKIWSKSKQKGDYGSAKETAPRKRARY